MKIVSTQLGSALQMIAMDEVRPVSGLHFPTAVSKIAERYQFLARPTEVEKLAGGTGKFVAGRISLADREIAVAELTIYSDGIYVETFNTIDADAVLDDFFTWMVETFGARRPTSALRPRSYRSAVVVDFEVSIDAALRHFDAIQSACASAWRQNSGGDISVSLGRFTLEADPETLPAYTNTKFVIERRAGVPFSENRYYAGAPLPTIAHLKLLEQIERVLLKE